MHFNQEQSSITLLNWSNWTKSIQLCILVVWICDSSRKRTGFCQHQNYYQQYTKCGMICVISLSDARCCRCCFEVFFVWVWPMQRELCTLLTSPPNVLHYKCGWIWRFSQQHSACFKLHNSSIWFGFFFKQSQAYQLFYEQLLKLKRSLQHSSSYNRRTQGQILNNELTKDDRATIYHLPQSNHKKWHIDLLTQKKTPKEWWLMMNQGLRVIRHLLP